MAHPFTPQQTFSDNTVPKVTAEFMNRDQAGLNAAARPVYMRKPSISAESTNGTQISIGPGAPAFMVLDAVSSEYVSVEYSGSTTLDSTFLSPAGSFAASTWYYVYGKSASGVIGFEISDTAPEGGNLLYKTGDETRRYLCCFRTDNGGNIVPFRATNGRYLYDLALHVSLSGGFQIAGTSNWQSWSLTSYHYGGYLVPPHVNRALFHFFASLSNILVYVRPYGTSYSVGSSPTPRFLKTVQFGDNRFESGIALQAIDVNMQGAALYSLLVEGFVEAGA
mgnify:CR=1 FL=1